MSFPFEQLETHLRSTVEGLWVEWLGGGMSYATQISGVGIRLPTYNTHMLFHSMYTAFVATGTNSFCKVFSPVKTSTSLVSGLRNRNSLKYKANTHNVYNVYVSTR